MFPVRDHNPSHKLPLVTLLLIAVNVLVFFNQISGDFELFVAQYALVPALIDFLNPSTWYTFLTSMYLHGGFFHLLSNMWFLWIFGDNVEARFGKIGFIIFYTFCGLTASLLQYFINPTSSIPTLGASGAIAGVLGAYLVLFPHARIDTYVVTFGGFFQQITVNAAFMLVYWFLIQIISGATSLGTQGGGVAWWAHIGGFVAGYAGAQLLKGNSQELTV